MRVDAFPNCCAARVISNFGGGHEAQAEGWTKQAIIDYMKKTLDDFKDDEIALAFCCVTTTQPNAIAALVELGFYGYDDKGAVGYVKRHRVFPFFLPLMEWDRKKFDSEYNPELDTYKNKDCYNDGFKYKESNPQKIWL